MTEDAAELYGSNEVLLDYGILAGTFHCSAHVDYTLSKSNEWFSAISRVVNKYLAQPLTPNIASQIKQRLGQSSQNNSFAELNQHLTAVFMAAMADHRSDAYDKFEDISGLIKGTKFNFKNPRTPFQVNNLHRPCASKAHSHEGCNHVEKLRSLLDCENSMVAEADKKLLTKLDVRHKFVDVTQEIEMLEWAGINFGAADAYKL